MPFLAIPRQFYAINFEKTFQTKIKFTWKSQLYNFAEDLGRVMNIKRIFKDIHVQNIQEFITIIHKVFETNSGSHVK